MINEIDVHSQFDGILKVVFSLSAILHGKSVYVPGKNVKCRCISSYVKQPRDLITRSPEVCQMEYGGDEDDDDDNDDGGDDDDDANDDLSFCVRQFRLGYAIPIQGKGIECDLLSF